MEIEAFEYAFPVQPVVKGEFRSYDHFSDVHEDIEQRIFSRPWTKLSIEDWTCTGDVETIAALVTPDTFAYYLPSILQHSLRNTEYLDWGVRAIVPHNRDRIPKGDWWDGFLKRFDERRRRLIAEFLSACRDHADDEGSELSHLLGVAEKIWT